MVQIRPIKAEDIPVCEAVLRRLPDWFGIDAAIASYMETLSGLDGFVAEFDGVVVGFVGLKRYGAYAIEIDVIGVRPEWHRKGIGTSLIEHVETKAKTAETKLLHMKTIAPSSPDPNYAKTRLFWERMGFIPMDTPNLWGERNPCLVMVKPI